MEEVEDLRRHKEWANARIHQLIQQMVERQRPLKDEAQVLRMENDRLRVEVDKMRQDKGQLEEKLIEFEKSLQRLKDSTYHEVQQKCTTCPGPCLGHLQGPIPNIARQSLPYETQAALKRVFEERVQTAEAELRGAILKDQEWREKLKASEQEAKVEKKKAAAAEKARLKAAESRASSTTTLGSIP